MSGRGVVSDVTWFWFGPHLVRGQWVFDPARPLEVRLRVFTRRDVVEWVWARQVLADVFAGGGPVGDGDVRVRVAGGWLWITLSSPEGSCELRCWDDRVESFLWHTYTLGVPRCPGCDSPRCESCAVVAEQLDDTLAGLGLDPGRSGSTAGFGGMRRAAR